MSILRILNKIKIAGIGMMAVFVFGCVQEQNFFRDRAEDYKEAKIHPKLQLPKQAVKPDNEGGYYDIPAQPAT